VTEIEALMKELAEEFADVFNPTIPAKRRRGRPAKPVEYEIRPHSLLRTPCWIVTSPRPGQNGYVLSTTALKGLVGDGARLGLHRAVYEYFWGSIPDGLVVRHQCDQPSCINPLHLLIGSYTDNYNDMVERGRDNYNPLRGERNHNAKLTEDDVRKIMASCKTNRELAKEFGVAQPIISQIKNGLRWKHITASNAVRRKRLNRMSVELLGELIKTNQTKSDRQIAALAGTHGKAVAAVRRELESCGEIPHIEIRIDTKGRRQASRK
jgi:hypothetical protein